MAAIERRVPLEGRILDMGCGHGLFSAVMSLSSPGRSILGVDPSQAKIEVATKLSAKLHNVTFFQGLAQDVTETGFDAVTILDVLYLLPVEEKIRVLSRCHEVLAPGGRLILKTNDTHPAWKFRWAWFQEVLMTKVGLTMSDHALYFVSCAQTVSMLRQVGFHEIQVVHLPTVLPYPHTLFSCTR
jgi:2-polyprenyl-6-hydroxyphenyl methylase/3-demethylubiquinone-9 3-methyltransferase